MINYTLPDFTVGLGLNLFFIRLARQRPAYFLPDVRIDSVYGCFPDCILNGGRTFIQRRYTPARMEETFALLAENGVRPRLTFTNMLARVDHLKDPYVEAMLQVASRFGGEVIAYSDEVGAYIQQHYGLKLVLSTTRALKDAQAYKEAVERYDWVVLNYNHHKDYAFIDALPAKERLEVMVNEFCVKDCPHRLDHYLHNSQDQMNGQMRPFECVAHKADFFAHEAGHPVLFTTDEVRALHDDHGIRYFKIVGRGVPFQTVLEAYVYYLVRPEYREEVRRAVMSAANG